MRPGPKRLALPASEALGRARALVVLLLGLYGVYILWPDWQPIGRIYGLLQCGLLGYLIGARAGWILFWSLLWLLNPITWLLLNSLAPGGPWPSPWETPSYGVALALSYGLNRLIGFGGRWPMQVAQPDPAGVSLRS